MGRQPVHLDKHLKGLEDLWILQFRRRIAEEFLPLFLHHDQHPVIVLCFLDESFHVFLSHPSAENVIIFFIVVLDPRGHLAHIEVIGQLFQPLPRSHQLGGVALHQRPGIFLQLINGFLGLLDLFLQSLAGHLGRPDVFVGDGDPLKVHGIKHRVHPAGV